MAKNLKHKVRKSLEKIKTDKTTVHIIDEIVLVTPRTNQFLLFIKPESFIDKSPEEIDLIADLIDTSTESFDVDFHGIAVFPGEALKKHQVMDRHYGAINKLSKNASKLLTTEDRDQVYTSLGITDKSIPILGGHEILEKFPDLDPYSLDTIWWGKSSNRIRSGFYVRDLEISGERIVAVNAFHPKQLADYTDPEKVTIVILASSDKPWQELRENMIGDGYPEKATQDSIRGTLYKDKEAYGFKSISIANNVIHMSAGPTEALFEINNFFSIPLSQDILGSEANLVKLLRSEGFTKDEITELINDPQIHKELELKDTKDAVTLAKSKKKAKS